MAAARDDHAAKNRLCPANPYPDPSWIRDYLDDPLMTSALGRLFASIEPAVAELETFMATTREVKISRSGAPGSPASAG